MWSNDNFILAPKEIKSQKEAFSIIYFCFFSIFRNILTNTILSISGKSKLLLANQLANSVGRAKIIDRNNNILAINVPAWTMYADPIEVLEPTKTAAFLHNLMPEKDLNF